MAVAPESLRSPSWAASRLSSSLLPAGRRRPRRRPQTTGSGRRPQTKRPIGTSICSPVGRCSAEGFWGSNASSLLSFSYTQLYGRIYHICEESPNCRSTSPAASAADWVGRRWLCQGFGDALRSGDPPHPVPMKPACELPCSIAAASDLPGCNSCGHPRCRQRHSL